MKLSALPKLKGKEERKKRIGRGIGSGKGGHTVGRGHKGQKARKGGGKPHLGFEGGQVPLFKHLPKTGKFSSAKNLKPISVSLNVFNKLADGEEITPQGLVEKKLIRKTLRVDFKILANGQLTKKVVFKGFKFSAVARKMVGEAGATIVK